MGRDHTQGRHREGMRRAGYCPCFAAATGMHSRRTGVLLQCQVWWLCLVDHTLLAPLVYMLVGGPDPWTGIASTVELRTYTHPNSV
jgi:hypothetical protein